MFCELRSCDEKTEVSRGVVKEEEEGLWEDI